MKDGLGILLVSIVLVGVIGWYFLPSSAANPFSRPKTVIQTHDPEPEKTAKEKEVEEHQLTKRSHVGRSKQAAKPDLIITAEVVNVPPPAPPPFPTTGAVKLGTERNQLKDVFGNPCLSAATADQGHIFETYVYKNDLSQAIIRLQDGKVSAFYTR